MIYRNSFWVVAITIVIFGIISSSDAWWWNRRRRRRACSTTPCQWKWGSCSKTCGGGKRSPIKTVTQGSCGSCSMPSGPSSCNVQCCPVNCKWKSWGSWGSCSSPCGGGRQSRTRSKTTPSCGGKSCTGSSVESRSCNNQCCPVDCKWSSWGGWGSCSAKCGGGSRSRVRGFAISPSCGGSKCIGSSGENEKCNTQCCPVNCKWAPWSEWEECSAPCGEGAQMRTRGQVQVESCGGVPCSDVSAESRQCNSQCCPVDCVWEEWSKWGVCSKSCGSGSQTRSRDISVPSHCGGTACVGEKQESQLCNTQCCPVDCKWGDWGAWGSCSKTCDKGSQSRNRAVAVENVCGGYACTGGVMDSRTCNDFCCPIDCRWLDWSQWSNCSKTCGTGLQQRNRDIDVVAACNGIYCVGNKVESKQCNTMCCPVNCLLSPWSVWSQCSSTCGIFGSQVRKRTVERPLECGGKPCDASLQEERSCNRFCFNDGEAGKVRCNCQDGWEGECCEQDIDECELGLDNCTGEHQKCVNTDGSFTCHCEGFLEIKGGECKDIDECALETDNCSELGMICKNIYDGFECGCPESLQFQNGQCIDIDECALGIDKCSESGLICKNTYGGYECGCGTHLVLKNGQCVEPDPAG